MASNLVVITMTSYVYAPVATNPGRSSILPVSLPAPLPSGSNSVYSPPSSTFNSLLSTNSALSSLAPAPAPAKNQPINEITLALLVLALLAFIVLIFLLYALGARFHALLNPKTKSRTKSDSNKEASDIEKGAAAVVSPEKKPERIVLCYRWARDKLAMTISNLKDKNAMTIWPRFYVPGFDRPRRPKPRPIPDPHPVYVPPHVEEGAVPIGVALADAAGFAYPMPAHFSTGRTSSEAKVSLDGETLAHASASSSEERFFRVDSLEDHNAQRKSYPKSRPREHFRAQSRPHSRSNSRSQARSRSRSNSGSSTSRPDELQTLPSSTYVPPVPRIPRNLTHPKRPRPETRWPAPIAPLPSTNMHEQNDCASWFGGDDASVIGSVVGGGLGAKSEFSASVYSRNTEGVSYGGSRVF